MISENLLLLLEELCEDNYGDLVRGVNPYHSIVHALPELLTTRLSKLADRLPDKEAICTLAAGEHSELEALVKQDPPLQELSEFLGDLFDGRKGWLGRWITREMINEEEK